MNQGRDEEDMMLRIALLDDYQDVATGLVPWTDRLRGATVEAFTEHIADVDRLAARLASFEVVVAMRERTRFNAALFHRLPALRLLVTTGMRNAAIDLDAARAAGVTVCGTRSSGNGPVELAWALLLAVTRQICREDQAIRMGIWQTTVGVGLAGKTLGVVGLGRLGSQMASIAHAFGMAVLAWSPHLTEERAAERGAQMVTKEDLFERSDVVTIHMVLSERTARLVGRAEIARMRSTAVLINTSRGGLVDTDALVEALCERRLAGAGIDVFDEEPLPAGHPLLACPNTVLTPHIGYVTQEAYQVFYEDALEDVEAFVAGRPVRVLGC